MQYKEAQQKEDGMRLNQILYPTYQMWIKSFSYGSL